MAGQIKFKQFRQIHPAKPMPHIIDTEAFKHDLANVLSKQ